MEKQSLPRRRNEILKAICLLMCLMMSKQINAQQTKPIHYYTFEGSNPLKDSMNNSNLNMAYYKCGYTVAPQVTGAVGNSLQLDTTGKAIVASPNFVLTDKVSIEFIFKASPTFNTTTFVNRSDQAFSIKFGFPFIQFVTNTTAGANNLRIDLEGLGRASYGYYTDGNYHHMVFKYNAATGIKEIWVDGQLPEGFSDTTAAGTFAVGTANSLLINANTSYYKFFGNIDEIAIYDKELPDNNIYKHYQDFVQQQHYTYTNSSVVPPAPDPVTGPVDINEFAIGHPAYTVSATDQLKGYPLPRFKKGNTLLRNFNWLGMNYFSSENQPGVSMNQAVANSVAIQTELCKNWNYSVLVTSNTGANFGQYNDPTKFNGAWVKLANQNPQWPAAATSFWNQLNPSAAGYSSYTGYIENKIMPASAYVKNSSGQFLTNSGNVTTLLGQKSWSPAAPLDSFTLDGLTQRFYINKLLSALTRPLDIISDNGEVIPKMNSNTMSQDPSIVADKLSSGISDWDTYLGNRKKIVCNKYRDQFMNMPALSNTIYSEYQIGGSPVRHKYSECRNVNKPINGHIYATPDFYPRWPSNWRYWSAAWNGWQHIVDGRYNELMQGDKLYSPFVSAGWNVDEERNVRPAQWLGLLKALSMTGAEFFYTGYFNEALSYAPPNPAPSNPAGYAYQAVMPVYAQAITSRYENILRNGDLMNGDVPNSYTTPTAPGYSFAAGDLRKLVVIRKDQIQNIYAITGSIQPSTNMMGSCELESDATVKLSGNTIQFKIRRQGSTYIYDNTNATSPVFYQLDQWHESAHPSRWSKDFNIESELYDNAATAFKIKTERLAGAAVNDFRNSTSYLSLPSASTFATVDYYVQPREAKDYYFWVRARSVNGTSSAITVKLDSITKTINCITDSNWQWYSIDACSQQRIAYTALTTAEHKLTLTATGAGIEIDRVLITIDGAINLNLNQSMCTGSLAIVTASGPLNFCQGSTVTLTAGAATNYQWSNGSTTQSITVSATGNYLVTVSSGSCSAVSAPTVVTLKSNPASTITASGSTTICANDSVQLSASAATNYAWSNGVTTQSIWIASAGNYSVTVTGANGCTKTSLGTAVSVSAAPLSIITADDSTNFCSGNSVNLTANSAASYLWSSGETTRSINCTVSGSYTVNVANTAGCLTTSSVTNINVYPLPSASITVSGSTQLSQGQSVVLTASSGSSFAWSNGSTTNSISVTDSGLYQVIVYNVNGCSATATPVAVTQLVALTASITVNGSSTLCSGDSVTLSAPANMATYAWMPNGETIQTITVYDDNTYSVIITDSNGNSATANTTVTVNPVPDPPSIAISYIPNVAYQLTANEPSAASYLWSNGQTSSSITIITPAIYSVQATNGFGCESAWGTMDVNSITAQPCSEADMLTTYNINDTSVTVAWNPAVTANSFLITYWEVGTTNYQTVSVNGNISNQQISGLSSSTTYKWNVQTVCIGTPQTSDTSQFITIINTLPCGSIPQNLRVSDHNTQVVNLNWYPTVATTFKVHYRKVGATSFHTKMYDGVINTAGGVLNNLAPSTTYEWKIQSTCNGVTTPFSSLVTFTTLDTCGYLGVLEVNDITPNNAKLMWENVSPMDTVRIRLTNMANGLQRSIYLSHNPTSGVYQVMSLNPNTTYSAQVRGNCFTGQLGGWSNKITFTTESIVARVEAENPLMLNGYPNPASDIINYTFMDDKESDYTLKVCDMSGRELFQQERYATSGPNAGELNVQEYATGLYMLIVQKGAQASRFRFAVH